MMHEMKVYAPGRTELAGNHTDHQKGRVIAAAVSCGIEMVVQPQTTGRAVVQSQGFPTVDIDIHQVQPLQAERTTTAALVRGVVAGVRELGARVPGFHAQVTSTIPAGGGLSSSAAFELALACALVACDPADVPAANPVSLARAGQNAEHAYFGKACGLMDQLAVALGGIVAIDFAEDAPAVQQIDFSFAAHGYQLCLIDTHCDHSSYTAEYSQVPADMNAVAKLFDAPVLAQVQPQQFFQCFAEVRQKLGDLPALRALHFFNEMKLVDARAQALRVGDMQKFLQLTRMSGASSAQYLQNVSTFSRKSQPAMVALALAESALDGEGAARIHGGGFGGSIQAFVPEDRCAHFVQQIDKQLGAGSCQVYQVGGKGAGLL